MSLTFEFLEDGWPAELELLDVVECVGCDDQQALSVKKDFWNVGPKLSACGYVADVR